MLKLLYCRMAACVCCRESTGLGGPLNEEEYHVIQGVLDLGHKKGIRGMTPLDKVTLAAAVTWGRHGAVQCRAVQCSAVDLAVD